MLVTARNEPGVDRSSALGAPPLTRRSATRATPWAWDLAQRALALLLLVFVLPLMLLTALAVLLQDGGPILFRHRRIGLDGQTFGCLKFRTMGVDAQERLAELLARSPAAREEWARDQKLRHDPRITAVGHFLRKTSLDELPQLFNVMAGEMNLVGPRPIVESEIARYGRRFRSYRAVKPGITGLWQVSGRNDVAYGTRVALDSLYARRRSLRLDLWILVMTVPAVLTRQGSC
jgi:lipopolysaccharide/colanic/teichoic acid biosynthesis glycosyltransferase